MNDANFDSEHIRASLLERHKLVALRDAIESAKVLMAKGNIAPELVDLLEKANIFLTDKIEWMGVVQSMVRMSDLAANHASVDAISDYIATGGRDWFDFTTNRFIYAYEALQEANHILEAHSETLVQPFMDTVSTTHPDLALLWLRHLLAQPISEYHRRILEQKMWEIKHARG